MDIDYVDDCDPSMTTENNADRNVPMNPEEVTCV